MKKLAMLFLILLGTSVSSLAGPYDAWSNNRSIVLNTSATGANVAGDVTNFPVLIRLNATEASVFTQAKAGGADIRFLKSDDATILPYQIERWNAAGTLAEIWVKMDTVYGNNSTQNIKMYWGNAAANSESNGAAVFDTAAGYQLVYHLNDTNDSTARDATANGYNAAPGNTSGTNPANIAGPIGTAKSFNNNTGSNASGSYYSIASTNTAAPKLNFNSNADSYTLSAWVKAHSLPNTSGTGPRMGIIMKYGSGSNQQYGMIGLGNNSEPNTRWSGNHKHPEGETWSEAAATVGQWQHVMVVRSGPGAAGPDNNGLIYVNGIVAELPSAGGSNSNGNGIDGDLVFGAYSDMVRFLDGEIDEITIADRARSADFAKLSYESQKPRQLFTNIGAFIPTVPASPANVAATAGNGQAVVTWIAPGDNGGAAITGYTVSASPGSATCAATVTLTCTVTGLTNGTPYTFTTTATNSVGTSVASAPSAAVTPRVPTVPGAPTGVTALASGATGGGQITVVWTAPADNGDSPITGYTARAVSDTTKACTTTGALNCSITGLAPGTAYTFTVRATNAVGTGNTSTPSNSVAPTVGINPGSFVFRVTGRENPYTFQIPATAIASTDKVTLTISDSYGRTVWSKNIRPSATQAREIAWNGRTTRGAKASAGMYVVRVSVRNGSTSTQLMEQTVTLKP